MSRPKSSLQPDKAINFSRKFDPSGWHGLTAIDPKTNRLTSTTIAPGVWKKTRKFILEYGSSHNLYFSVNEPSPNTPDCRYSAKDIAFVRAAVVDIDAKPNELITDTVERAKSLLEIAPVKPTCIVESGGGVQAHWLLDQKIATGDDNSWIKGVNNSIKGQLDGDDVGDLPRLMRLPGTLNFPTGSKKKKTLAVRSFVPSLQNSMMSGSARSISRRAFRRRVPRAQRTIRILQFRTASENSSKRRSAAFSNQTI